MASIQVQRSIPTLQIPGALQRKLNEALMSNLGKLDPGTLAQLHNSFFEAAQGPGAKMAMAANFPAFASKAPAEALLANFASLGKSYYQPSSSTAENLREERSSESQSREAPRDRPTPAGRSYAAQAKGPGIFSNPAAEKAQNALRQQQAQTQNFLNNQMGQAYARGDMAQFLGPTAYFEDVLAAMLFKLADKEQRDLMEQLRIYERSDSGLNGLLTKGANALGGAAGSVAGGLIGSAFGATGTGAAVGYDIGQKVAGNVAGEQTSSSKQVQYQKIQMSVQNMTNMMQMLSTVLAAFAGTNKTIVSNIRS